jgi:hypothetical protein
VLGYRGEERVAAPEYGFDDALIIIVQRHANIAHATRKRLVRHRYVGPDRVHQLVPRYQPARVLDHIAKDLEAFRPEFDFTSGAVQARTWEIEGHRR